VIVRTGLDISDEAYYIAKAIAKGASNQLGDYGFPTFRCARPVTTEDVKVLEDEG
jgi:hypothetical protein